MNRAANAGAPRAIADTSKGRIVATVEIAVPPERVFRALTESSEVLSWWGSPETYQTTSWSADARNGGSWKANGSGADGKPFSVGGKYLEVDPPRRLVQTWEPDWDAGLVTTLTYRLEVINGGTRLTLYHEGFGERHASCEQHSQGWELVLGWLCGHLS